MDYTLVMRIGGLPNDDRWARADKVLGQTLISGKYTVLGSSQSTFRDYWIVKVAIDESEEVTDGVLNSLMHTSGWLVWWNKRVAA